MFSRMQYTISKNLFVAKFGDKMNEKPIFRRLMFEYILSLDMIRFDRVPKTIIIWSSLMASFERKYKCSIRSKANSRASLKIDKLFEWILWMANFFCLWIVYDFIRNGTERLDLRSWNDWPRKSQDTNCLILI